MTILHALSGSVVVGDERRALRVTGKDAVSWLNGLVTCDVAAVDERRAGFGLLLTKQGKILTDLLIVKREQSLLLGVSPAVFDSVRELLDRYLVMEDAELEPAPECEWLYVLGDASVTASSSYALGRGRADWLRVAASVIVVSAQHRDEAVAELVAGGALLANSADVELLRLALGFPKFGVDYGPDDNPHEAALERRAVSWTKGCYLGQEVVCMQDMRGRVKRRLVPLELTGAAPAVDAEVRAGGEAEPVGRITSSAADGERTFVMARLRAPFFDGSAPLEVQGVPARIVAPNSAG